MAAADFLLEIGTEELPPKSLKALSDALTANILAGLQDAELSYGVVESFATPRRLALTITDLALQQPQKTIERKGPSVTAPEKAIAGFAKSCGVEVGELTTVSTNKGEWLLYRGTEVGQATKALLPELVQAALDKLPIAKRMRWGARREPFVRPVRWLLMLLANEVVPANFYGISADRYSYGHRFHTSGQLTIRDAASYASTLKTEGKVVACFLERRELIREQARQAAALRGLAVVIKDDLLDEVTALTEWPVALVGKFDAEFLSVPAEALISSMEGHQKYFPAINAQGAIQPYFIFISNIESADPAVVINGNERVIRPRLADAAFFWQTDQKTPLGDRVAALKDVKFQESLGSLYEKVLRVQKTALHIAGQTKASLPVTERAAYLAKADLVTDMVAEFPELQGIAGYHYALASGEPEAVATAVQEHYKPAGASDNLPTSPEGMALALADRLDNLTGLFGIGQPPSGTKDPFALRRAALGVLRIIIHGQLPLDIAELVRVAADQHGGLPERGTVVSEVTRYIMDRLLAWYEEQGIDKNQVQAVAALSLTQPYDFDRRVQAVAAFSKLEEAKALAAANKRVANILAKADYQQAAKVDAALFAEPAETALLAALSATTETVMPLVSNGQYSEAMSKLAELDRVIDEFFSKVMVMAESAAVRNNRLALLCELRTLFTQIADISLL